MAWDPGLLVLSPATFKAKRMFLPEGPEGEEVNWVVEAEVLNDAILSLQPLCDPQGCISH